jgi:hypothetical protein
MVIYQDPLFDCFFAHATMDPENYWGFGAISNTCPTLPNNGHCSYSSINIHRGCTLQDDDDAQQKKRSSNETKSLLSSKHYFTCEMWMLCNIVQFVKETIFLVTCNMCNYIRQVVIKKNKK